MKRSAPLKRSRPLRARSAKQTAAYAGEGGRRAIVAELLAVIPSCEAGPVIGRHLVGLEPSARRVATDPVVDTCAREPADVHEILPRSAGGSILERANLLVVCRSCHQWIHEHPRESRLLGLLSSRYGGT